MRIVHSGRTANFCFTFLQPNFAPLLVRDRGEKRVEGNRMHIMPNSKYNQKKRTQHTTQTRRKRTLSKFRRQKAYYLNKGGTSLEREIAKHYWGIKNV